MISFDPPSVAWCICCAGPQTVDDEGCTVCRALRQKHAAVTARRMVRRRARLKAKGVCINAACHGAPEPGKTKCTRCIEVHRKSNKPRAS